jgi:exodeoxyribonuclease VII large subunit
MLNSTPLPPSLEPQENIYTVTQLNREARQILEGSFPSLWVEGELSNFKAHTSGHWYFSLKDAQAQISCAFFRAGNRKVGFQPKDGLQVKVRGQVSLYEGRGSFQLIVDSMEEAGQGKLQKAFEALKKRLAEAGLFDPAHKKPLPTIPKCIGVITSPTGAAIRDILSVLKRRFPGLPVIIYPTVVQGEAAAPYIVKALQTANHRKECDVLILARGGGSLEDLWPFNEEIVAQAIYQSELPIISGVGHEIDFTIADFVADKRAPTPSGAAEQVAPDRRELWLTLQQNKRHLIKQMQAKLAPLQQELSWNQKNLQQQHPQRRLAEKAQLLDSYELNLVRLQTLFLQKRKDSLKTSSAQLLGLTPTHRINHQLQQLQLQQENFKNRMLSLIQQKHQQMTNAAATLDALSPLNTLGRGYAITSRQKDQRILRSADEVQKGDKINVRLKKGSLTCLVEEILK